MDQSTKIILIGRYDPTLTPTTTTTAATNNSQSNLLSSLPFICSSHLKNKIPFVRPFVFYQFHEMCGKFNVVNMVKTNTIYRNSIVFIFTSVIDDFASFHRYFHLVRGIFLQFRWCVPIQFGIGLFDLKFP